MNNDEYIKKLTEITEVLKIAGTYISRGKREWMPIFNLNNSLNAELKKLRHTLTPKEIALRTVGFWINYDNGNYILEYE
ncbi:hypothetical protein DBR32_03360 [Taibaiella sp. KBW10]|uniref:hypothetical protein n=1 Tax=Taibaiella sp. KBW10 TaxID=2153357 RepID=UPI000F5A8508|nr:hypothetical protein [Taibaiella sp. KBW10]RQO32644.1 hypothetical protein DBR32_03360 [Taibaiella sp. KBW10]